jgi:hypothetical protein
MSWGDFNHFKTTFLYLLLCSMLSLCEHTHIEISRIAGLSLSIHRFAYNPAALFILRLLVARNRLTPICLLVVEPTQRRAQRVPADDGERLLRELKQVADVLARFPANLRWTMGMFANVGDRNGEARKQRIE